MEQQTQEDLLARLEAVEYLLERIHKQLKPIRTLADVLLVTLLFSILALCSFLALVVVGIGG